MKDFLTADQTEQLKEKKWTVNPKGFWVELYKEDFTEMAWKDYCKIIGASLPVIKDCIKFNDEYYAYYPVKNKLNK